VKIVKQHHVKTDVRRSRRY